MKFQNFLNEKISKIEYEQAITNPNVLCGGEFEFYVDDEDFESTVDEGIPSYDDAYREWDNFTDELIKAKKDYEAHIKEIEEKREEAQELKDDAENNYEERLEDYEIDELEDQISDIKDDIDTSEDEEEINDWKNNINDLENQIKIGKEQQAGYDRDIRTADDLEEEANEMDDNVYEYIDEPYIGNYGAYLQYMEYYHGEVLPEEYYSIYDDNDPPEPIELHDFDSFEELVDNWLSGTDAPFGNNYRIGYVPGKHDDFWSIEPDASLDASEGGIEIVSPPLEIEDFVDETEDMFYWINRIGETNSSTGFHVHMSVKNGKENFDPLKLLLFTEEEYIWKYWSERKGSHYTQSILKKKPTSYNEKDLKILIDVKKLDKNVQNSKYDGVNFVNIKDGHVEFRYMGGNDYSKKFKEVRDTLARYSYWLSIACDPDFKRREYLLKINKVLIKKEYITHYNRIKKLENSYKAYKKRNIPNLEIDKWFTYELKKAGKEFASVGKNLSTDAKMDALKNIPIEKSELDVIDEYINTNAQKYLGGELYKYLKGFRII